jgi:hypothetical protein
MGWYPDNESLKLEVAFFEVDASKNSPSFIPLT